MLELHLGDCLEIMPTLASSSVDAIICDLPYGSTACSWDVIIPFDDMWKEYKRVIKPSGAIVLFGSQPFTSALVMSNPKWFKYEWIWNKVNTTGFLDAKRRPLKKHENIVVFCKGQSAYNPTLSGKAAMRRGGREYGTKNSPIYHGEFGTDGERGVGYPQSIIEFQRPTNLTDKDYGLHPTQKPIALLEYLVKTYTNAGDTVLDNCMGSGTTGVACMNTGRKFIGIEKEENYFAIAKRRIEQAQPALLEVA